MLGYKRFGSDFHSRFSVYFFSAFLFVLFQVATLVRDLRKELDRILENKIENPSFDLMSCERGSRIIDVIVRLISTQ